jgi:hypothetical protein
MSNKTFGSDFFSRKKTTDAKELTHFDALRVLKSKKSKQGQINRKIMDVLLFCESGRFVNNQMTSRGGGR